MAKTKIPIGVGLNPYFREGNASLAKREIDYIEYEVLPHRSHPETGRCVIVSGTALKYKSIGRKLTKPIFFELAIVS